MTIRGKSTQTTAQIISADRLRQLLSYDQTTGAFTWVAKSSVKSQAQVGCVAGGIANARGAMKITVSGRSYWAHHLAWLYVHGEWPRQHIDHINGNASDNRISNLRDVSLKINGQNKRHPNGKTASGLIGAHWARDKWQASIKVGGRNVYLGKFETAAAAHAAYVSAKRRLHEGCTI